ncbi:multiple epidermal growth factor-like domains protein 11 [Mytilus californianus]|uniref:multiple epidermal growth factor-like domains protein 11 n=1 Tax=Mytilus californianus TaxID=6549 RepID=UPI002245F0C4|nr:multiple epidermal growth factor-like domains protein 11 [Mytilus californianus]
MRFKTIILVITVLFSRTLAFPNLAANGSAIQSSVYRDAYNNNYGASKVIDGNTNQLFIAGSCCHTDIGFSSAWWRLDLGYSAYIHRVVMYYRGDQSPRIKGYYLYVSDSFSERNPNSGHECYHYPMSGQLPNTIQNKTCDLTGRYVVYYNERDGTETFVDLCEVEVFGCYLGRYGSQCQSNCSLNCNDGTCSIWGGSCTSCKAGFKGNHCDQGCEVGTYGPNCVNTCNHCKNKDCNQFCGRCTHGCSAGWKGSSCQIRCSAGTFGENCSFVCNCLDGNTCDDVNGHCPHELCDPGWKSNSCSQSCVKRTFGKNCLKKCTDCITDNCNRFNGTCDPFGICKSGWRGQGCNFKCDTGSYGINCSLSCSNCINESCDHLEGICQTVGSCKAGYRGSKCNQSCSLGHFGYKCANKCTGCLDGDCEPFSGNCTKDGCRNDYTGYRCHLPGKINKILASADDL